MVDPTLQQQAQTSAPTAAPISQEPATADSLAELLAQWDRETAPKPASSPQPAGSSTNPVSAAANGQDDLEALFICDQ
jgi:predicted ATPase